MREIKFRGKRIDNDEWVYGNLVVDSGYCRIITNVGRYLEPYPIECRGYTVATETVGQYIGLDADNKKKVYEGDILGIDGYSYYEPEGGCFGVVGIGAFGNGLEIYENGEIKDFQYLSDMGGSYTTTYTVFGNIHDNPELIKEVE